MNLMTINTYDISFYRSEAILVRVTYPPRFHGKSIRGEVRISENPIIKFSLSLSLHLPLPLPSISSHSIPFLLHQDIPYSFALLPHSLPQYPYFKELNCLFFFALSLSNGFRFCMCDSTSCGCCCWVFLL